MDVKAYTESGILELYVAESLPPAQMREVESLAEQYPEIRERIELIRETLDQYSLSMAEKPDPALKERILAAAQASPSGTAPPGNVRASAWRSLVGWGVALLAFLLAGWCFYNHRTLSAEMEELRSAQSDLREVYADARQRLELLNDPATRTIVLSGSDKATDSEITVFWNPDRESTLLSIRRLPPPPAGKQYQLWSLVDQQPSDAGLLDYLPGEFQAMVPVSQATAFAITLEDEGGSEVPTLSELYAIGRV